MKILFLVTELYEPAGGLYRYTTNLLSAWKDAVEKGKTDLEPFFLSVKNPSAPLKDLAQSERFKEFIDKNKGVNVYEAERGGEPCYFLEGKVPDLAKFHWDLWNRYGIDSWKTSRYMDWYNDTLSVFWYWAPRFAEFIREKEGMTFKCIDAQDWLAFPAGFLARDRLNLPLVCRFHSGEYGRSLGEPDLEAAPIQIEAAALDFADYIQGVSISESIFQTTHLMPLKRELDKKLKDRKGESWYRYQKLRDKKINSFLLYESEQELVLLKGMVGSMPNGIYLKEWEEVTKEDIEQGRESLEEELPRKDDYIFFIGRATPRKGLDFLLQTFSKYRDEFEGVGLAIASSMKEDSYQNCLNKLKSMEIEDDVLVLDRWLEPDEKRSLMCASDVIALPSVYEPFGIVALEGLAADYAAERNGMAGPVVVAGNTGGMDEIIRSGVNGFEVPIQNFEMESSMLKDALLKALDDEIQKKVSKNGAERVQSKYFRWSFIFKKILEIYDRVERNWKERIKFYR